MAARGRSVRLAVGLAVLLVLGAGVAVPAAAVHESDDGSGGANDTTATPKATTTAVAADRPDGASTDGTTNAAPRLNRTGASTVTVRVGEDDARMRIVLDFSLFSNVPAPGRLEFATAGSLAGERVVAVELGLSFLGAGDPFTFLGNPFSRFAVDAHSELSLPFLAESPEGEVRTA